MIDMYVSVIDNRVFIVCLMLHVSLVSGRLEELVCV